MQYGLLCPLCMPGMSWQRAGGARVLTLWLCVATALPCPALPCPASQVPGKEAIGKKIAEFSAAVAAAASPAALSEAELADGGALSSLLDRWAAGSTVRSTTFGPGLC